MLLFLVLDFKQNDLWEHTSINEKLASWNLYHSYIILIGSDLKTNLRKNCILYRKNKPYVTFNGLLGHKTTNEKNCALPIISLN